MADRLISTGLPAVRFSAERRAHVESLCDDLIERALDEHHAFHAAENSSRWKSVRQKDALTVYRVLGSRPNDRSGSKSSQLVCSGLLAGTVENALNGVYCDTTETLHLVKSILSDKFLDGRVVHVLENNSMDAPIIFTGIKWFATKSPGGNLIHDRDMLTFEVRAPHAASHAVCYVLTSLLLLCCSAWAGSWTDRATTSSTMSCSPLSCPNGRPIVSSTSSALISRCAICTAR